MSCNFFASLIFKCPVVNNRIFFINFKVPIHILQKSSNLIEKSKIINIFKNIDFKKCLFTNSPFYLIGNGVKRIEVVKRKLKYNKLSIYIS